MNKTDGWLENQVTESSLAGLVIGRFISRGSGQKCDYVVYSIQLNCSDCAAV